MLLWYILVYIFKNEINKLNRQTNHFMIILILGHLAYYCNEWIFVINEIKQFLIAFEQILTNFNKRGYPGGRIK